MANGLPRDPMLLLSVVNTKLRDYYHSLDALCDDMNVNKEEIISALKLIDYAYDSDIQRFVWIAIHSAKSCCLHFL